MQPERESPGREPPPRDPPPREPLFRAPWPVLALVAVLLGAFAIQSHLGVDAVAAGLGFSPQSLGQGRLAPVVVSIFLHGGWLHVMVNSAFILAFGTPVSRRCGLDPGGAAAFFGLFLACGIVGNLGYALVHPDSPNLVVGASGAGAGLMAATARLMTRGPGLAPLFSGPVATMTAAFAGVNLLVGAAQGLGVTALSPGTGGAMIAWEVHLFGYVAGLFLLGPLLRLMRRDW